MALNPIIIRGPYFYDSVTKNRFFIKGIAYAPDLYSNDDAKGTAIPSALGEDHFSNDKKTTWEKDIPLLADLGINCVRLYNVNPTKSHDLFMNTLAQYGIYALIPATSSTGPGVLDSSLRAPDCYTSGLLRSAKDTVVHFSKYNNTLGFVAGNEVSNAIDLDKGLPLSLGALPCVKALIRDLRSFMKMCTCTMRYIPLFYAGTDFQNYGGLKTRDIISQYLNCGEHSPDAYGLNIYTWCALDSSYSHHSTYKDVNDAWKNYPIPMLFSEYGCNYGQFESHYPFETMQRKWTQVHTLLGSEMWDVWSGGFAYEYSMTSNDYGMVLMPGYKANQPDIEILENYNYFKKECTSLELPSFSADWSNDDFCQWMPSIESTRNKPNCPSHSIAQALFHATISESTDENWSSDLPATPNSSIVEVDCGQYPMPTIVKKENKCSGGNCVCDEPANQPSPSCHVSWDVTNIPSNVGDLFGILCGNFINWGKNYSHICTDMITPPGRYGRCNAVQKANYLLKIWMTKVNPGLCCADAVERVQSGKKACVDITPPKLSLSGPEDYHVEWRGNATFHVSASGGTPPYTYLWYRTINGGTAKSIENSNSATYRIFHVTEEFDYAEYRCDVTDSAQGRTSSRSARLRVFPPDTFMMDMILANADSQSVHLEISKFLNAISDSIGNLVSSNDMLLISVEPIQGMVQVRIKMRLDPTNKNSPISSIIKQQISNGNLKKKLVKQGLSFTPSDIVTMCEEIINNGSTSIGRSIDCSQTNANGFYAEGSTCNFTCVAGYYSLSKSKVIETCQDGQWRSDSEKIICEHKKKKETPSASHTWIVMLIVLSVIVLIATGVKFCIDHRGRKLHRTYFSLQGEPLPRRV